MSAATTSAAGRLTDAELKAQEKAARKAEKARQKRIAADEAADNERACDSRDELLEVEVLDDLVERGRELNSHVPLPLLSFRS